MSGRRTYTILDRIVREIPSQDMTWTETGIMRRSQPWIWEKGVPGKENSKCKSPEVEMILECSGHRIATMLSDFKEQNKDGEWSRKCSQPSLSTVSLSSWVYSKRITFTEAAFACPTNYPSHLLITLFSKHTSCQTTLAAGLLINFCLSFSQGSPKTLAPS